MKTAKYTDPQTLYRVWMANLAVPSRSGLSEFSSMDHIEFLGHSRKQHRAAVLQAAERASSWLWLNKYQENWKL